MNTPRVACSTSAFKLPLAQALARVAVVGFSHVDVICIESWGHVSLPRLARDYAAHAAEIAALLAQYALTPVALNMAFTHHPHQRSEEATRTRLAEARGAARLMQQLGVQVASFYPGYKVEDRAWADVRRDTLATLKELQVVADDAGVVFAPEPHHATPLQTLPCIMEVLDAMPELRIAYDPSHFAMQGLDVRDTAALLDRAAHVHVRDARPDVMYAPCGTGTVDMAWLVQALAARAYRGWISIECLPKAGADVEHDIAVLRQTVVGREGAT